MNPIKLASWRRLTPLMRAAWNGHRDVVDTLIQAGANASRRDAEGNGFADYLVRYEQGRPVAAAAPIAVHTGL